MGGYTGRKGTHDEKRAEGAPALPPVPTFLVLTLAQAMFWPPITMLEGGTVSGGLADHGGASGRPSASIRLRVSRTTASVTAEPSRARPKDSVSRSS